MKPIVIHSVFSSAEIDKLVTKIDSSAVWEAGKATAGPIAGAVKNNLQAREGSLPGIPPTVTQQLFSNEMFNAYVRPTHMGVMISRYDEGGSYGTHVDDGLMGVKRRDVSFTIFLSPPNSYDGGELIIENGFAEESHKLGAGHMVVYPATTLHRVEPVTRGSRLVIVGWARSLFRSHEQREMIFELICARRAFFEKLGKTGEIDLLSKAISNLTRMWATD